VRPSRRARGGEETLHLFDKLRRGQCTRQPNPLNAQKFSGHDCNGVWRFIDDNRREERHPLGHQMGAFDGELPLEAKIALAAALRMDRDDRYEKGTFFDLPADILIPRIAAAEFALV